MRGLSTEWDVNHEGCVVSILSALSVILLSALGSAIGSFAREYVAARGRKEGEIDALRDNLDEVVRQLRETTKTAEMSKAAVASELEHDRKLFNTFDAILPEAALREALDGELYAKRSTPAFPKQLHALIELAQSEGGRFLDTSIQMSFERCLAPTRELSRFIGRHFFQLHQNQAEGKAVRPPLALYPELKYEEPDAWFEKAAELDLLCERVAEAYGDYRRCVKSRLAV